MFNDKYFLTQAVLNGTKTMTRRVISTRYFDEVANIEGGLDDKGRWIFTLFNNKGEIIRDVIPCYNIGDVVAIAQPYKDIIEYLPMYSNEILDTDGMPRKEFKAGWTNKMFVRAGLMPHHIRITDVKAERLQDIPEEEILKEGVWQFHDNKNLFYVSKAIGHAPTVAFPNAREAFAYLIDSISGNGTWDSNPWVVAYSFELVD